VTTETGGVEQQRGEPLDPSVHRDVINLDTAFEPEFFNVASRRDRVQATAGNQRGRQSIKVDLFDRRPVANGGDNSVDCAMAS
jgi:hypothetical protein